MNYVRGEFVMKSVNFKKITILFFSTAFLILIFSLIFLTKKKLYNAELLLNEVKGSYIVQEPIVLENINHNQPIYQGGITVLKNDHLINYEFYADAVSGQIIDIIEL